MEDTTVGIERLSTKKKWAYSFHSQLFLQIENHLRSTNFKVVRLGSLVEEIADGLHGTRNYVDDGIVMLAVGNITEFGLDLSNQKMVSQAEHECLKRSQVQYGDLLVTITGRLGTTLVYTSEKPANLSAHVARVKVKADKVEPYYLAAYLNSNVGKQLLNECSIGSIYPHINVNGLQNVRVVLPPRPIQDKIAHLMQEAYAAGQDKLVNLERLYQTIDKDILGKFGIDITKIQSQYRSIKSIRSIVGGRFDFEAVVTMQEINFGLIKPVSLKEVVRQVNNRVTPIAQCANKNINYVGLGNIASNIGELVNFFPVKGEEVLSSSPKFEQGDILFGRMRPYLNKVWLAEFDGVCSGEVVVLRPNKQKVDPLFLQTLLLSQLTLNQVVPLQSGTSLPRVSASDVLSIKLPIPENLNKQTEISAEISRRRAEARRLRTEAENSINQAKARVERMILGEEDVA